jgi:hypothetical protein
MKRSGDCIVSQALKRVRQRCAERAERAERDAGEPGELGEALARGYAQGCADTQDLFLEVLREEMLEVERQTRAAVLAACEEDFRARMQALCPPWVVFP